MQIRFIRNYGYVLAGSTPSIEDKEAKRLIEQGYAIEITESKHIEKPKKDKMIKKPIKTKSHSDINRGK